MLICLLTWHLVLRLCDSRKIKGRPEPQLPPEVRGATPRVFFGLLEPFISRPLLFTHTMCFAMTALLQRPGS